MSKKLSQLSTIATVQSGDLFYVSRSATDKALTGAGILAQFSPLAGSTSIATVGTITAGTWQGSVIAPAFLGSGSGITAKFLRGDGTWQTVSAGSGDVVGPASAVDGRLVLFDGVTGKLLKVGAAPLVATDRPEFANLRITHSTLSYAASVALDFDGNGFQTVTLAGNITFTTSNLTAGRSKTIRIIGDGSMRTLTFPAWVFVGAAAPADIAAGKTAILTITAFGTTDASCVAAFAVEP